MAFVSLGLLELVHSFNVKSDESIFKTEFLKNKYIFGAFILGGILQIGVAVIPGISNIFNCVQLNSMAWIYTIIISISPLFIMELQKKINEIKYGKTMFQFTAKF